MKEESSQDNDNSNSGFDESGGPLSIDTSEQDSVAPKPTIRINKGIQIQANSALKRKASETNGVAPIVRKVRPSNTENEAEINTLEKEIKALHWLARRKEQEWDQVIRLLKQKEEKLLVAQRNKVLIRSDTEMLARSVIIPKKNTLMINNTITPKPTATVVATTSPATYLKLSEDKINSALQKANANLEKESTTLNSSTVNTTTTTVTTNPVVNSNKGGGPEDSSGTPLCQGCKKKKSEFVCAGCGNRWYCSRDCQVEDWDEHADDCSG